MVDIAISYFYQIRFFKPYMIPISTAISDPAWYHNSLGPEYNYIDKNGVVCGLRSSVLPMTEHAPEEIECRPHCPLEGTDCSFMRMYLDHLHKINFYRMMKNLTEAAGIIQKKMKFEHDPIIVLIVHEPPTRACSERPVLKRWFSEFGLNLRELDPKLD